MNSEFKKTPFYDMHVSLGAQMGPFGGYMMPIRYKGIIQEHHACRKGAVLFDTCHMGEFIVKGRRALADLENIVSCDVSSMETGQCRYGLMCNDKGGVIDDLLVYRRGDDEFMLVVNAGTQDNDFAWIQSHVSSDTFAENISDKTAKFDLQGPGSVKIVQKIVDEPVADLKFYHFQPNTSHGKEIIVSRTGYTGEMGFEIYSEPELSLQLWNRCMELGAEPAGLGARDTLRLEMGMPLYGHELSEKRNAAESGFVRAISQSKKFIGSKVVLDNSQKKNALVGINLEGRRAARNGDTILDESGRAIGEVTSGSFAPSLEIAIAMGYVENTFSSPGCRILIQTVRQNIPGVVCELPFYKGATARKAMKNFC
ncbi:MAG: glycine cleavage system aminomethyltransferase GcvT [Kiritimatiellae bacterium]|nr:glycine cleavage system aminomethyltransferase GcvT [Kiritimatiellia bacterium]MDD5519991.1 glycine cleavage system aminomethyltransferase GcvT [Kiritimatiellia bacterium]